MLSQLKDYLAHFKDNKFIYKTVTTYTIIACIIFCVYSITTIIGISHAATKQITQAQHKMLENAANTYDMVLRSVNYVSTDVFESNEDAFAAMTKPYSSDTSVNIAQVVSSMKNSASVINSVYFFNFGNNVIYNGENPVYSTESFPDQSLLEYIKSTTRHYSIFVPYTLKCESEDGSLADKQMLMSLYKYNDESMMAVFIESSVLNNLINTDSLAANQDMTVLNSSGLVLSSRNNDLFAQNLSQTGIYSELLSSSSVSGTVGGAFKIYCYRKSDIMNCLYVSTLNRSDIVGSYMLLFAIIVLFTLLLILMFMLVSIQISASVFRPFKRLRQSMVDILNIESVPDEAIGTEKEISLVSENLKQIKKEYDSMQKNERLYSISKRNELTYDMLSGSYNFGKNELAEHDISLPYGNFSVLLLRIDNAKAIEPSNVNMILYGLGNIGSEFLTGASSVAYSSPYGREFDISFLINHKSDSIDTEAIENIQKYAKSIFNITVSAAYDTASGDMECLPQLYRNAQYAMQYRFVRGSNSVIPYASLNGSYNIDSKYPIDIEKRLLKEISSRNDAGMREELDKFFERLSTMPYVSIIVNAYGLISTLNTQLRATHKAESSINDVLSDDLMKIEFIDDLKNSVLAKCNDMLITASNETVDTKHMMIAKNIEEYVDNHYTDPNLSIDIIAAYVNKSTNYARSLFKKCMGISISDYITKKRFDTVCTMLIETNLTAQAIGQKIGMSSGSYFYTAFKKYTGYTPEQYRNKYARNVIS